MLRLNLKRLDFYHLDKLRMVSRFKEPFIISPFPWDRVQLPWAVIGVGTAFSFLKSILSARKVDVDMTHDSMQHTRAMSHSKEPRERSGSLHGEGGI